MNFNYELTAVEYIFMGTFLVLYVLYVGRTFLVARALGATARAVVIKFFLRATYFALLIVALLGPFFGEPERDIVAEGKDIMVLVDVSKSMDATDIQPSRLEKVKFELQRLISSLGENRFGLIVFSASPFLQVPLTFDLSAFELFAQSLSTAQVSSTGTDICSALDLCTQKLLQNPSANTSKIILLMTDGENFGTCERKTLASIRQFGLNLFIVGIGTNAGGHIRQKGDWVKDENGQVVTTKLNSAYLRELAMATNGKYFEINNRSNAIAELVSAVNSVESRLIDSRKVAVVSNKYRYFLLAALVLIALDVLVTVTTFQV
ncbi:vWA domain-containing protein [Runella slithyformis]|uniref:von Willebrand factor type A n=1 Tax=Runella slithyformis (strain ATCC 29530 / DSM 19594 / LMG 11500 / NCIMB 11436 / LSU 4) TaxID=761193 RepID=A0A7U3ZMW6_RUNSL|nr:VWA domain-containing protein [Runella slithyformis]AEI50102.1 von Willebrand factor type A [Runella slithyformis DSM 19594]